MIVNDPAVKLRVKPYPGVSKAWPRPKMKHNIAWGSGNHARIEIPVFSVMNASGSINALYNYSKEVPNLGGVITTSGILSGFSGIGAAGQIRLRSKK